MQEKTILSLYAMTLLAGLEGVNLAMLHLNGALFGVVVAGIAGLAGYEIGKKQATE